MALLLSLPNYLQAVADDTWVTGVYAKMWLNSTLQPMMVILFLLLEQHKDAVDMNF